MVNGNVNGGIGFRAARPGAQQTTRAQNETPR
jgi:hypothetical protein